MEIERDELMKKLAIVLKQVEIIARISPNSIDNDIYKQYSKAYTTVKNNGELDDINISGLSRPYADNYGYEAPLLKDMSAAEILLKRVKG